MKKIIVSLLTLTLFFIGQGVFASSVSWNTDPTDCNPGSGVGNATPPTVGIPSPGSNDCWNLSSVNASSGDIVNVQLYYHNTGNQSATNTRLLISVSPAIGQISTVHTFTSTLTSDQGNKTLGTTQVVLSTAQKLNLGTTEWHANQGANLYTSSAQIITSSSGLSIGTINAGWPAQGATVTSFTVNNSTPPPPQNCTISNFSANPNQVSIGGSFSLSWNTNNCTSVSVTGPNNFSSSSLNGPQNVTVPNYTGPYTYYISASNQNGSATPQQLNVSNSILNTTGTLIASPSYCTIPLGGSNCSIPFSWTTTNPPQGAISAVTNNSNTVATGNSGNQSFNISYGPQTYFLYNNSIQLASTVVSANCASGSSWNGSSCLSSIVNNCSISIYANPTSINSGNSSILNWSATTGCNSVYVSGPNFSSSNLNGNQTIYPPSASGQYTYTITATGANGSYVAPQYAYVNVNNNQNNDCSISYFRASPSSINSGDSSILSWDTNGNCNSANISAGVGSVNAYSGNKTVYPNYTTTYTLTVYGNSGYSDSESITVYMDNNQNNNCSISYLTASPTSINYGGLSTLSWSTNNCTSVSISNIGSVNSYGSQTIYPTSTTSYTIYAYSSNGTPVTKNVQVYVNNYVAPPTPIYNNCAVTGVATNIGQNSVTLNGLITSPVSYGSSTYFEYGKTVGLGLQTSPRSTSGSSFSEILTGLSSNTIYFYRIVSNCGNNGIARGSIEIFQTASAQKNTTTIIRQGTTVIGTESPIMLKIENRYQSFRVGDMVDYTVTYKNISNRTLTHPLLQVILPKGVAFLNSSRGTYISDTYTLTVSLEDLVPNVEGVVYLQGRVDSIDSGNAQIVTTALLVYTARNGAQENAMAYVLNNPVENSSLGALALFGNLFGFGIIGWLLILILILLIILLFRKIYRERKI